VRVFFCEANIFFHREKDLFLRGEYLLCTGNLSFSAEADSISAGGISIGNLEINPIVSSILRGFQWGLKPF